MRQIPFANPFKVRINVRPLKIAYFVTDDEPQVLQDLISLICTQWGGVRHLIINLEEAHLITSWYQSLLKIHEPDWYVLYGSFDASQETTILNSLQEQMHKIFPQRFFTIQQGGSFEKHYDNTAHALSVLPDTVAKSKTLTLPEIVGTDSSLVSSILFGRIYSGQEKDYQNFLTTSVQQFEYGSEQFWLNQMDIEPFSSVLNLTSYQIYAYSVTGGWHGSFDHFDIVICDSSDDYITFWNMRALRECGRFPSEESGVRRTLCLPIDLLDRVDRINTLFDLICQKLFKPGRTANLDIRFYSWNSKLRDKAKTALQNCPLVIPFSDDKIRGNTFGSKHHEAQQLVEQRPLTYLFSQVDAIDKYLETVSWSLPLVANLKYGENEIRFEPPDKYFNRYSDAVAVDFECDIWSRYPKAHSVAAKIAQDCWFSKYGISSAMMLSSRPAFLRFNLPDEQEALHAYFREKGYELTNSKVGQYSDALVDLVGGLEGISIFASQNCYRLLDTLALKSTKKVAQRIVKELNLAETMTEEIVRVFSTLELPDELKDIPRTSSQIASNSHIGLVKRELFDLLDKLVRGQILKRGFYLDCPNCGNSEWYSLSQVDEFLTCPGCGIRFVLPVRDSGGQEDIRWRYRLNTTVNRAIDQDALVALLAVYHLSKEKQLGCFGFGIQLKKDGRLISDIDFLCISNSEIHTGECKAGTRLDQKDFDNAKLIIQLSNYWYEN